MKFLTVILGVFLMYMKSFVQSPRVKRKGGLRENVVYA